MGPKRAIIISLAIHLLLALALGSMASFAPPPPRPFTLELQAPTEQERQDARKAREKADKLLVRQAEVPEKLKTNKEREKRFFSERDQTVLEERRAQASGLTQNRSADSFSSRSGVPGMPSDGGRGEESKGKGSAQNSAQKKDPNARAKKQTR